MQLTIRSGHAHGYSFIDLNYGDEFIEISYEYDPSKTRGVDDPMDVKILLEGAEVTLVDEKRMLGPIELGEKPRLLVDRLMDIFMRVISLENTDG